MGGIWKFSNSEQTVPSLSAIPHSVWLGLGVVELVASLAFVLPAASQGMAGLAPIAAIFVATEMGAFCALHLASTDTNHGTMVYWAVVAGLCAFVAYGRLVVMPH